MPRKDAAARQAYDRAYRKRPENVERRAEQARKGSKAYYWRDRDKRLAQFAAWRAANPERVNEIARTWRAANPGRVRESQERHRVKAREQAAGRPEPDHCEICGGDNKGRSMVFDHDHSHCPPKLTSTGKRRTGRVPGCSECFRGWICNDCNLALGHVYDDPERLRALIAYLKRSPS